MKYKFGEVYHFEDLKFGEKEFTKYCNRNQLLKKGKLSVITHRLSYFEGVGFPLDVITKLTRATYSRSAFLNKVIEGILNGTTIVVDGIDFILNSEGPGGDEKIIHNLYTIADKLTYEAHFNKKESILFLFGSINSMDKKQQVHFNKIAKTIKPPLKDLKHNGVKILESRLNKL